MIFLRQSTASQEIPLGRFVDSTDGNTEETGLTIANTDIKIWKTGATTLADKNSGGATHIANGEYYCVLDATDTNTIGPMKVSVHVSGALYVQVFCCVLDEAVYDALFGIVALATAENITKLGGQSVTATKAITTDVLTDGIKVSVGSGAGQINASGGKVPATVAVGDIADSALALAKFAADIKTGNYLNAQVKGQDDIDFGATQKASITAAVPTVAGMADGVWDEAIAGHLGAGSTGAALNAAGSAGDPWTTPLPGAYGAGTAGKIIGDNINAPIGTVDTVVDAIKAKTDNLPASPAAVGSNMGTVSSVTGDVSGKVLGGGASALSGTGVRAVDGSGNAIAPASTALTNVTWTDGRAAKVDNLDAAITSRLASAGYTAPDNTNIGNIQTIVSSGVYGNAALKTILDVIAGYIDTEVAAILAAVDTEISGIVTELAKVPKSDGAVSLNATVLAAIADKMIGRSIAGGADGGRTFGQALRAIRNKVTIAAGIMTVYAEDDVTPSWTAAVTTAAGDPVSSVDPT